MKKIGITVMLLSMLSLQMPISAAGSMQVSRVGEYITLGKIEDPLLLHLLKESQHNFRALSDSQDYKGILIDGLKSHAKTMEKSPEIRAAISKSVPMIISSPSSKQIGSITGAGVSDCDAAVIIPHKKGEEFEIYTLREKSGFRALANTNRIEGYSSTIRKILGTKPKSTKKDSPSLEEEQLPASRDKDTEGKVSLAGMHTAERPSTSVNAQENHSAINSSVEDIDETVSKHRRWYILDADSYVWGKRGAFIRNGFQYDLVYVSNAKPERKYLIMRTIGLGVSPGNLRYNHMLHRGYFQNKVDVSVSGYGHNGWTGEGLFMESYAPQSLNRVNQEQDTVGVNIGFNAIAGVGFMSNTGVDNAGAQVGFTVYDQHSVASTYDDYSVTFESTATIAKWSFWLSGANGVHIRKKHQASDLLSRKFFLFDTVRELPQLATGSVLQPDVQAVYYTSGDQLGKWTMTGTTEQHLLDVRSWILFGTWRKKSCKVEGKVTIDFSKVGPDGECEE